MNDLLQVAVSASIKAGKEILKIYHKSESDFKVEYKGDQSPLTIADKVSHNTIKADLEKLNIPILSEEGKQISYDQRKNWSKFWLIDPLDGTKEFIKKNDEFTVNIALIENGQPVMGVIYVPVKKELYYGVVGKGAWLANTEDEGFNPENDSIVALPKDKKDKVYRVVGSRSHMNEDTTNYIDQLRKEHPDLELTSSGSSLKICMVATGEADIYPRFGPTMEWDVAAGHAIAKGAGKNVYLTDEQNQLQYNKENLLNPYFIVR